MTSQAKLRQLLKYLDGLDGQPFVWGSLDCHTFVMRWVDQVAGTDICAGVVGCYGTAQAARDFLKGYGRTLVEVLEGAGCELVPEGELLEPGDVLLAPDLSEPWERSHLYLGSGHVVSVWPGRGVRRVHLAALKSEPMDAWRPPLCRR